MDPPEGISIAGDTSFALGLEAQRRGHQLFVYTPDALSFHGISQAGRVTATGRWMRFIDRQGSHLEVAGSETLDLATMDVILLRQDPPFDMQYITTTHLLEKLHPQTLVVNNPVSVRNAPEKLLVTAFPQLMPPTLISRDPEAITAFRAEHGDIIVKPLFGNGGAGVFHLRPEDSNLASLLEMMFAQERAPLMIQQYLPAVRAGDKRVILIDGEAVAALNRIPAEGEARSNMHVGGRPAPIGLDDDDRRIAAEIGPLLRDRELLFVGIDVIGGMLTEINVTSPTGIREILRFGGPDIAALLWDSIEQKRC